MGPEPTDLVELESLLADFPGESDLLPEWLEPGQVPEPAHGLLVHHHHMTVTLEAYYAEPVELEALSSRQTGSVYTRKLLLRGAQTGRVVLFGVARIHLDLVSEPVRIQILAEKTPLGRILIDQGVLRRVERTALLRYRTRPVDRQRFGLAGTGPDECPWMHGRLALLYCDGEPAIELLEVVRPGAESVGG